MYVQSVFTKRDLNSHMKRTAGWIVTYEVSNESHLTCLHILRYSTVKLGLNFLGLCLPMYMYWNNPVLLALHRIFGRWTDGGVHRVWWIQDGATAHRRIIVYDRSDVIFPGHVVGLGHADPD